jgi:hypothetical protein
VLLEVASPRTEGLTNPKSAYFRISNPGTVLRISTKVRYPMFLISSVVITVTMLGALLAGV